MTTLPKEEATKSSLLCRKHVDMEEEKEKSRREFSISYNTVRTAGRAVPDGIIIFIRNNFES